MIHPLALALLLTGAALAGGSGATMPTAMPGMDHAAHARPGMSMNMQAMGERMTADLRLRRGRAFDVRFAQLMIEHHQAAIDMARVEVMRGTDARVKAAARRVISAQEKEIALMREWLRGWGSPQGTATVTDFLGTPDSSWDRWFLSEMIPHHRGAISMARLAPTHTQNAQVRALAADIIKAQQAEITQYTAWQGVVK